MGAEVVSTGIGFDKATFIGTIEIHGPEFPSGVSESLPDEESFTGDLEVGGGKDRRWRFFACARAEEEAEQDAEDSDGRR